MNTRKRIDQYVTQWKDRGYPDDIPDSVPDDILNLNIAPSYKAIAMCLLKNDVNLHGLGFTPIRSKYYDAIKRVEISMRNQPTRVEPTNGI